MSKNALPQEVQPNGKEISNEKKHPFDFDNDEIPGVPLAADIKDVTPADMKAIEKRVAAWHKKWPDGEPEAKRLAPYRVYIKTIDIMLLSKCSLRSAQRLLQNTRFVLGMKKGAHVKISEFCEVNDKFKAEDVREFLQAVDAANNE